MAYVTGSFKKNSSNLMPYLYYTYTQNKENNTSTVTLTLKIKKLTSYAQTNSSSIPYSISINGSNIVSGTTKFDCRKTSVGSFITIASKSKTLTHNDDGTLKIKISAVFDLTGFNPGKGTVSSTEITLSTIPRRSTLSLDTGTIIIGNNDLSGTIKSHSSNFYHKLTYNMDSTYKGSYNITKGQTSFSCPIPEEWAKADILKDSLSTNCTVKLYTYSDSNYSKQIGDAYTTTCRLMINTSDDVIDDYFTFNIGSVSPLPNLYNNIFITNKTSCLFSNIDITSTIGSDISYIRIVGSNGYDSGQLAYASNNIRTYMTPKLPNKGYVIYTIYATDSKGITVACPDPIQIYVEDYTLPKFNSVISSRVEYVDNEFVSADEGTSLKSVIDFDYFKLDKQNTVKELVITISKQDQEIDTQTFTFSANEHIFTDTDGISYDGIENNGSYYYVLYMKSNLSIDSTYIVTYSLTDLHETVTYTDELSSAYYIIDISPNGRSIAFGKAAEEFDDDNEKLMDVAMPLRIKTNDLTYDFRESGLYINNSKAYFTKEVMDSGNTSATITLDNESCNYTFKKALKKLTINISNSTFSNLNAHIKIIFVTNTSSFTFSSDASILYTGTDCSDKSFSPIKNKLYIITFEYGINDIIATVSGIGGLSQSSGGDSGSSTEDDTTIYDFPYADDLVAVAKTYWSNCANESDDLWSQGLTYRASNTPLSGTCEVEKDVDGSLWVKVTKGSQTKYFKAIDCSTLVGLSCKSYTYELGPYASKDKFTAFRTDRLQKNDDVTWSFNMTKENGGLAREASAQCEYFDRIGKGIVYYKNIDTGITYGSYGSKDDDFAAIKKGDIVFYAKKNSSGEYVQADRYMKVSHVAIAYGNNTSGKNCVIESTNGTMTKNHTFSNGSSINAGVRIVSIAGDYGYSDDIVMVVRPQPIHYNS